MTSRVKREHKWRCVVCGWQGVDSQLLEAPSPFRDDDILTACPKCRMTEGFDEMCQVDGCTSIATCGTPMLNGYATFSGNDNADDYIRTCGKHIPKERITDDEPN